MKFYHQKINVQEKDATHTKLSDSEYCEVQHIWWQYGSDKVFSSQTLDHKDAINRRLYNNQSFVLTAIYRVSCLNRTVLHLVEIDLLRVGEPMLVFGDGTQNDYRILVSRAENRPQSDLYSFDLQDVIPSFPLPLRTGDSEPLVDLQSLLAAIYERASYDLYQEKREQVLASRSNLVEIDLLRKGEPMPMMGNDIQSHYRILVCRGDRRPYADLYAFNLPDIIPTFPLPLRAGDTEPVIDLQTLLNEVYDIYGYDLVVDYSQQPPVIARRNDEAIAKTMGFCDYFAPLVMTILLGMNLISPCQLVYLTPLFHYDHPQTLFPNYSSSTTRPLQPTAQSFFFLCMKQPCLRASEERAMMYFM